MNILILEDEPFIAYDLKRTLDKLGYSNCNVFKSYEDAKRSLTMNLPNIAFIDIQLAGKQTGLNFAEDCKKIGIPFIITTSFTDETIIKKAIKHSPIAYIVKPYKQGEILAALTLYKQKLEESLYITITDGKKTYSIITNEVLYLEADTPYINIHTTNRIITIRDSLTNIVSIFNSESIIRVHKSYAVSLKKINSQGITFLEINNVKIPISKKYYSP